MVGFPRRRSLVSVFVLLFLLSLHPPARASGPDLDDLQPTDVANVRVAPVLAAVFEEVLHASATFRAQCGRITQARYVRVTVLPVMSSSTTSRGTARTTIKRFAAGALIAAVEIPVPLTMVDYAELFGHEFEHIIEQIDRVNLAEQLLAGTASRLADGAFETDRARAVGHVIAGELDRAAAPHALPPPPPLAERMRPPPPAAAVMKPR